MLDHYLTDAESDASSSIHSERSKISHRNKPENAVLLKAKTTEVLSVPTPSAKPPKERTEVPPKKTRELYGPNERCYVMDAKGTGNIGRYLNVIYIFYRFYSDHRILIFLLIWLAFVHAECFCAERVRGYSRFALPLGSVLCSLLHPCRYRINLGLQLSSRQCSGENFVLLLWCERMPWQATLILQSRIDILLANS